ncbi:hypothetical protein TRAPUB_14088 [Trametes pubescens]|uniref:Uncharacterized protein n=1 Tax=Trametes pubescens TaxID=154538 RepID=A0A1M2VP98_TRAPU|nr:hypothetical protein TRAPUB_14088 [Trametes pubescens]
MSSSGRQKFADRTVMTDEANTFKKPFQTVDRPQVTERDIQEDYMQDPPRVSPEAGKSYSRRADARVQNEPFERKGDDSRGRGQGLKEGVREETNPQDGGVLGDQATGKELKQSMLESFAVESSVHPGHPI